MTKTIANAGLSKVATTPLPLPFPCLPEALDEVRRSVDRFCLLAGVEALGEMLAEDAEALCGPRHVRSPTRRGYRWGTTRSELAYHGGKVKVARPRVRDLAGGELSPGELGGALGPGSAQGLGAQPHGPHGLDPQVPARRAPARG